MSKVVIPRLKSLKVENFELYPRNAELGVFEHEFVPGVNVILGINGLGKTTLLNLIFRLLIGPYDPSKADRVKPGKKQAAIKHANIDFFKKRVSDHAVHAFGTAVFAFGDHEVEITRRLDDLRLASYRFEGKLHEAGVPAKDTDDELMELLCRLAGFDTTVVPVVREADPGDDEPEELPPYRYDFDFLIRNLVFFLEDKVPLIWNAEGQFVILRILLVDEALSKDIALARNEILKVDSIYRNRVWNKNLLANEIKGQNAELRKQGIEVDKRDLLVSELGGVDARRDDQENSLSRLRQDIERVDAELLRTRADLFDAEMSLRDEEAGFFQSAFATATPPGELIVQALAGRQGCLVCGTRSEDTHRLARERLERHCCPVCESHVAEPAGTVSFADLRKEKLSEAEDRVSALQRKFDRLGEAARNARSDYEKTLDDLGATRMRQLELRGALAAAEGAEQIKEKMDGLHARFATLETEVNNLDVKLELAVREHELLIRRARSDVERFSDRIVSEFNRYAQEFMVDECTLRYKADRRGKVGQGDRVIDWPAFEVEMSSGEGTGTSKRESGEAVSESQKEFVDLAFRMALLRAASEATPSMLAVETPEASLDAVFMARAGKLLREFGAADPRNVLVVSSNLTGESMIPSLLGVGLPGGEDLQGRLRRVVDLFRRARPTKALVANRKAYEDAFAKAVGAAEAAADVPRSQGADVARGGLA